MIAGLNIFIFTTITILAHKEGLVKARNNELIGGPVDTEADLSSDNNGKLEDLDVSVLTVKPKDKE
jgi:hypothetical protein